MNLDPLRTRILNWSDVADLIPNQMGVEFNLRLVENFARHVAPALGWQPTTAAARV